MGPFSNLSLAHYIIVVGDLFRPKMQCADKYMCVGCGFCQLRLLNTFVELPPIYIPFLSLSVARISQTLLHQFS